MSGERVMAVALLAIALAVAAGLGLARRGDLRVASEDPVVASRGNPGARADVAAASSGGGIARAVEVPDMPAAESASAEAAGERTALEFADEAWGWTVQTPRRPENLRVTGRILDRAGAPVSGASVRSRSGVGVEPSSRNARSDARGRYLLDVEPDARSLAVTHTGYHAGEIGPISPGMGADWQAPDLVLERAGAGTLRLLPRTGDGAPWNGMASPLQIFAAPGSEAIGFERFSSSVYLLPDEWDTELTPGRYIVRAEAEGCRCSPVTVDVADGATSSATLVFEALPLVRVRVVDDASDAPIADAEVRSYTVADRMGDVYRPLHADTEANGVTEVARAPDAIRLEVRARGYAAVASPRTPGTYFIEVEADAAGRLPEDVEVRLVRSLYIEGTVVDAAGEPALGASIRIEGLGSGWGTSDTDGRFSIELEPGPDHVTLIASNRQAAPATVTVAIPPGARRVETTLVLGVPGAIEGRLIDASGAAIEDGFVRVRAPGVTERDWQITDGTAYDVAVAPYRLGSYHIDSIRPGRYDVRGEAYGFRDTVRTVDVPAGDPVVIDLILERGLAIAGRCLDGRGAPVEGELAVRARAPGAEWTWLGRVPLDRGRFALSGFGEARVDLAFFTTGFAPIILAGVAPGSVDLVLHATPQAILRGHVSVAGHPPPRRISVTAPGRENPFRDDREYYLEPDGGFEAYVDSAAERIRIEADGCEPVVVEHPRLAPGEVTALDVHFIPAPFR